MARHSIGGWNKRPVAPGMKWCPRCKSEKPLDAFSMHGEGKRDGYCKPCKAAKVREGALRLHGKPDLTAPARFAAKVIDGPNGCRLWTGAIGKHDGYGRFVYQGHVKHAHRVALILLGYDVPDDMDVDHCVCRIRHCVAEAHLRVATERQNALENNESPHARNARKTHCTPHHHPLSGSNVKIVMTKRKDGTYHPTRKCLACYGPGGIQRRKQRQRSQA